MNVLDAASAVEELFRDAALRRQARLASSVPAATGGVCTNCGEPCSPLAVYCDADCRADHEHRLLAARRAGAPAG